MPTPSRFDPAGMNNAALVIAHEFMTDQQIRLAQLPSPLNFGAIAPDAEDACDAVRSCIGCYHEALAAELGHRLSVGTLSAGERAAYVDRARAAVPVLT